MQYVVIFSLLINVCVIYFLYKKNRSVRQLEKVYGDKHAELNKQRHNLEAQLRDFEKQKQDLEKTITTRVADKEKSLETIWARDLKSKLEKTHSEIYNSAQSRQQNPASPVPTKQPKTVNPSAKISLFSPPNGPYNFNCLKQDLEKFCQLLHNQFKALHDECEALAYKRDDLKKDINVLEQLRERTDFVNQMVNNVTQAVQTVAERQHQQQTLFIDTLSKTLRSANIIRNSLSMKNQTINDICANLKQNNCSHRSTIKNVRDGIIALIKYLRTPIELRRVSVIRELIFFNRSLQPVSKTLCFDFNLLNDALDETGAAQEQLEAFDAPEFIQEEYETNAVNASPNARLAPPR